MKSLLILRNIKIENANAISGFTYGFPAISSFLGFTHALSRKLSEKYPKLLLNGCAVVSHEQQIQAYRPRDRKDYPKENYVFSLTRNPLTKEAKTPAFVEEGRMHLVVSLIIECDFDQEDIDEYFSKDDFLSYIKQLALLQRIAGGTIIDIKKIDYIEMPEGKESMDKKWRKLRYSFIPGFILVDRKELLAQHFESLQKSDSSTSMVDAWLDFVAVKYKAEPKLTEGEQLSDETDADWIYQEKPNEGWLVPINTGYRAISDLYQPGEVKNTRDKSTEFRFAESVHSVGQWLSPHRIHQLNHLFWRYQPLPEKGWYLCENNYQPQSEI